MNSLSQPATVVHGISPSLARELRHLGVHTVGDLLRVYPERLRNALNSHHSIDQIRAWCNVARFLQISVMTPKWAQALTHGNIHTLDAVRRRDLANLRGVFIRAKDEEVTSDIPDDVTIATMMKEAAVLEFTGALNGTIFDQAEHPVHGANICMGAEIGISDDRGRFRIINIPLTARSTLAIRHPECHDVWFRIDKVDPSYLVCGKVFHVRRLRHGQKARPHVLMEARGDVLPPIGTASVGLREVERDKLLDRDLFNLTEFSADKKRCKLVSKLLSYENGLFWLSYVWLSITELPPSTKAGDCFVLRHSLFEKILMNPIKLRDWPAMLRTRRQMGKPPNTVRGIERWLDKGVKLMDKSSRRRERY